jgi:hypothetical protein
LYVLSSQGDTAAWAFSTGSWMRQSAAQRSRGVRILEAYPVDKSEPSHDEFMFFGSRSLYESAGFTEVERRSPTRVVMRRELSPSQQHHERREDP